MCISDVGGGMGGRGCRGAAFDLGACLNLSARATAVGKRLFAGTVAAYPIKGKSIQEHTLVQV